MAESERTAFHEFADYLALPRLTGLALSPDGTRLVTTVGAGCGAIAAWISSGRPDASPRPPQNGW